MSAAGPRVSVVIPCFNGGRWIGEAIESVYRQTWTNLELVVVNDGSTDNSLQEIMRHKSASMTVIDQENRGQTASLNRGLSHCTGTIVQYLDADDALAPNKIMSQVIHLKDNPDCVAAATWRVTSTAAPVDFADPSVDDGRPMIESSPVDWLVNNWGDGGGMMYPAMWLTPMEIVKRVGPWREDLTLMNDTEYFTRIVLASRGVVHCPESISYYRKGHVSMSSTKTARAWRSYFEATELCSERLLAAESSDRTRRVASFLWQRLAQGCYPYERKLGSEALRRANLLHADRLRLTGGLVYNLLSSTLGWKVARTLQVLSGRT
jgi:glycosyltransferase involved in cell wall biosynthesis